LYDGASLHLQGGGTEAGAKLFPSSSIRQKHVSRYDDTFDNARQMFGIGRLNKWEGKSDQRCARGGKEAVRCRRKHRIQFARHHVPQPATSDAIWCLKAGVVLTDSRPNHHVAWFETLINRSGSSRKKDGCHIEVIDHERRGDRSIHLSCPRPSYDHLTSVEHAATKRVAANSHFATVGQLPFNWRDLTRNTKHTDNILRPPICWSENEQEQESNRPD
jgi:hypothetical protein